MANVLEDLFVEANREWLVDELCEDLKPNWRGDHALHRVLVCALLQGVGAEELSKHLSGYKPATIRQHFTTLYGKVLDLLDGGLGIVDDPHESRSRDSVLRALEADGRYWRPDAVERLLSLADEGGKERLRIVRDSPQDGVDRQGSATRGIIEPIVDGERLRDREAFRIEVDFNGFDYVYLIHFDNEQTVKLLTPNTYVGGPSFPGKTIVTVPGVFYDPFKASGVGSRDTVVAILFKREDPLRLSPGDRIATRNLRAFVNAVVDFDSRNRGACTVIHRAYTVVNP